MKIIPNIRIYNFGDNFQGPKLSPTFGFAVLGIILARPTALLDDDDHSGVVDAGFIHRAGRPVNPVFAVGQVGWGASA